MPKKTPKNSRTSAAAISRADKIAEALRLRRAGLSFPKIAKAMNIKAVSYVHKLVSEGINRIVHEPAEALVKLENARLDEALEGIYQAAIHGDLGPLDRLIKISESRRKLLGLDAPAKQEVKTEIEVAQSPEEMRAELGEVFQRLFDAKQQNNGGH